jgi:hypothetical protein
MDAAGCLFANVYPMYIQKTGYHVEEKEDEIMQKIHWPDKLVDELAKRD